ncbi:hypothetical protein ACFLRQ_00440 [Bacteroidota bacterium]
MKKLITIVLFSLLAVTLSQAQENEDQTKDPKIGIALNLITFNYSGVDYSDIIIPSRIVSVPLNLRENFRLEPEFAFMIYKDDFEYYSRSEKHIQFGSGIFYRKKGEYMEALFGVRTGVTIIDSDPGYYFSPLIGVEYHLFKGIHLGGEIQFANTFYGDFRTSKIQIPLYLRLYFN